MLVTDHDPKSKLGGRAVLWQDKDVRMKKMSKYASEAHTQWVALLLP